MTNPLAILRQKLTAKLSIADAGQAVREAKAILEDPSLAADSGSKGSKLWQAAKAGGSIGFLTSAQAKDVIALAVAEVNGGGSKPATPSPTPAPTSQAKPAPPGAKAPVVAGAPTLPKPAAKQITAPTVAAFPKKPDLSSLKGMERVSASMKFQSDRSAHYLAEAEKIVAAEEAANQSPDPTAGQPITAASIAKALLREQQEAAKPRPSGWSQATADRKKKVADLAAELMRKNP